jgi:hypothetical protein
VSPRNRFLVALAFTVPIVALATGHAIWQLLLSLPVVV